MGTRSLTIVQNFQGKDIMVMYRQFDGYPSGHGLELANFLTPFKIVNGFGFGIKEPVANGMGCLAAQLVRAFKEDVGGIYIYPCNTRKAGQDYHYIIKPEFDELEYRGVNNRVIMTVFESGWTEYSTKIHHPSKMMWKGPAEEYQEWLLHLKKE